MRPLAHICLPLIAILAIGTPALASPELWCFDAAGVRLDAGTGEYLGLFTLGGPPFGTYGFVLGDDGYTYVAGGSHAGYAIARYDSQTYEFYDFFAPGGSGGLSYPRGMAFGPDGNLYVSSYNTDNVLRYDGTSGEFLGALAWVDEPEGLTFGPDGDLYVAARGTNEIRRYDGKTGQPLGVFASGDTLDGPYELRFRDDGKLYVSNYWSPSVAMFDGETGESLGYFVAEQPPEIMGFAAGFDFGPDGNLYIADNSNQRITRFDGTTGEFIDIFNRRDVGFVTFIQFVVPEPGSLLPLAAGGVILLRRRR
jgi:sugar lactone lactonase YvrE